MSDYNKKNYTGEMSEVKNQIRKEIVHTDLDASIKPTVDVQQYSNAERVSHINNVQENHDTRNIRYGHSEKEVTATSFVGGVASSATSADTTAIFKTESDNNQAFRAAINEEQSIEKNGVIKTALNIISREIENSLGYGDGDITDRAKGQAAKYGYISGKYAVLGGAALGRGTYKLARYGKKLSKDVSAGIITKEAARKALLGNTGKSLKSSISSMGGIIKTGTGKAVADFRGSDDLGMQAITKPKDVIVKTNRSLKMAKKAGHSLSKGIKATKNATKKVAKGGRALAASTKKVFSNPVVIKSVAMAALACVGIAIILSIISSITSFFPTFSLKSEDWELSKTYLYVTELDARMEEDIINEDTKWHFPEINDYKYYINGVETTKEAMEVCTNPDLILAYFDSKYDEYTFAGMIPGVVGVSVKVQIGTLHETLHQVEKVRWTEEIVRTSSYVELDTGIQVDTSWTETVYHMNICLTTQSFENYLDANKNTLLTSEEQEKLSVLQETGIYSFRKEIANPFVGVDWTAHISDRWGWRIHPISKVLSQHDGIDIAMAGGTPINACMPGTASVHWLADGYGNYVTITDANGNYTLYAHMSAIAVSEGQIITAGDVIGYVGTTGDSTGNHLHLEYNKDGHILNPLIFVESDVVN